MSVKHFKLIACEILFREFCACLSDCPNIIDVSFMEKGLHDMGEVLMKERLQEEIDKTDFEKYDAILLGYGLCNNGVCGLHAPVPLVIARAHDCITLLMGSKEKYKKYFFENSGVFFRSPGWIERDVSSAENEGGAIKQLGMKSSYEEYAELYGEENAAFLSEMMGDGLGNYKKITWIDTKVGLSADYRQTAVQEAKDRDWEFEEIDGDLCLLKKLVNGQWDEADFLVIPPEHTPAPSYGDDVINLYKK